MLCLKKCFLFLRVSLFYEKIEYLFDRLRPKNLLFLMRKTKQYIQRY